MHTTGRVARASQQPREDPAVAHQALWAKGPVPESQLPGAAARKFLRDETRHCGLGSTER